ncbi:MAG: response regulator transcription factor [Rectinema sp.]
MAPIGKKIKVLVADDQRLVRDGIASLLGLDEEILDVGTAENGKEAVALARQCRPDVCLLDIRMPIMDGISALEHIRAEGTSQYIVMLTTFDDREYIVRSIRSGADGYLLKDLPSEDLVRAIKQVVKGVFLANGEVMNKLLGSLQSLQDEEKELSSDAMALEQCSYLTERERHVLALVGEGLTNSEIAETLSLSEGTVKNYISNILTTLGFRDRIQAALFAARNGLVRK